MVWEVKRKGRAPFSRGALICDGIVRPSAVVASAILDRADKRPMNCRRHRRRKGNKDSSSRPRVRLSALIADQLP
jgi:hypothetical protein